MPWGRCGSFVNRLGRRSFLASYFCHSAISFFTASPHATLLLLPSLPSPFALAPSSADRSSAMSSKSLPLIEKEREWFNSCNMQALMGAVPPALVFGITAAREFMREAMGADSCEAVRFAAGLHLSLTVRRFVCVRCHCCSQAGRLPIRIRSSRSLWVPVSVWLSSPEWSIWASKLAFGQSPKKLRRVCRSVVCLLFFFFAHVLCSCFILVCAVTSRLSRTFLRPWCFARSSASASRTTGW